MQASWLLDPHVFDEYRQALAAEIVGQGHVATFAPETKWGFRWEETPRLYAQIFPAGACVVFHGSFELAAEIQKNTRWRPGVYGDWPAYACARYYPALAPHLLNADYVMLPFGELPRRRDFLFDLFGREGAIFARPNSCRKEFTGQLVRHETFAKDFELMAFYDVPSDALVVISSPKTLVAEWRFVVVDRQVVAASQYKANEQSLTRSNAPAEARAFAEGVAAGPFQPDRVWTLDVCETAEGALRLVEIGAFSSASLYGCDLASVVREVSRAALDEWRHGQADQDERS